MKNKIIFFLIFIVLLVTVAALLPRTKPVFTRLDVEVTEREFPGKDVFATLTQWGDNKEKPFYNATDLERMLKKQDLVLDKDVYLNYGIFIDNPVKITSAENRRASIYLYKNSVSFSIFSDDIFFENVDFYLSEVDFFVMARIEKLQRRPKNISFKNCKFFLYTNANLVIDADSLLIENSFIKNERRKFFPESSLLWLSGKDALLYKNLFLNFDSALHYPIFLDKVENATLRQNAIISFQQELSALVTASVTKNLLIENNYFEDLNFSLKSLALGSKGLDDEDAETSTRFLEGSVALWLADNDNLKLENNVFGTNNVSYDPRSQDFKLSEEKVQSEISENLSINCAISLEFLTSNDYLRCKN